MPTESSPLGPETTMGEVLAAYPGAQRALFAKYHIGGCASCGFQPDETLGGVCQRNEGIPVEEAVAHILESHAKDQARQLDPGELRAHLDSGSLDLALLDLRTREEFENARIGSADLFSHDKLQEIMGSWAKNRPILIYDHRGESGCMDAAAYLEGHGFEDVKTLRGGIDAYAKEVDPSIPRYRLEIA